tara:strand:- start:38 stop:205 length:168 start_codon:yes stop_codon:yes gene_type:complete
MFDLRKCQDSPTDKPFRIAQLKKAIADWDEKFLKTQGRAGKRRLEGMLRDLENNS